eukprot:Tbor_TRINITY_DN5716_c1_g1::TRINITY_DN5716_c1_g1_i1::g.20571::m.20571
MVFFAQLVCGTCRKILTYPLGALSCRCRNCHHINTSLHMEILCNHCSTTLLLPVTTTIALCPCCFTINEIPISLLPEIPEPVILVGEERGDNNNNNGEGDKKSCYVEYLMGPNSEGNNNNNNLN